MHMLLLAVTGLCNWGFFSLFHVVTQANRLHWLHLSTCWCLVPAITAYDTTHRHPLEKIIVRNASESFRYIAEAVRTSAVCSDVTDRYRSQLGLSWSGRQGHLNVLCYKCKYGKKKCVWQKSYRRRSFNRLIYKLQCTTFPPFAFMHFIWYSSSLHVYLSFSVRKWTLLTYGINGCLYF